MAKARIEFHDEGFIEVLTSSQMRDILADQAQQVARRAGAGFEARPGTGGRVRARAFVSAETPRAVRKNARSATLLRALGR